MREIIRIGAPLLVLALGVGVFLIVGRRQPPIAKAEEEDPRLQVETRGVEEHQGLEITVDGLVVPFREISRAAEVAGRIKTKWPQCNEGTFVVKGMPLVEIDPVDYKLEEMRLARELEQARANLSEVKVEIESTQQLIELSKRDLELRRTQQQRLLDLRRRNAVSQQEVDDGERGVITAKNSLLNLQNQLSTLMARQSRLEEAIEVVKVQQQQAALNLKRTLVEAPVSGVIVRDEVEADSYVQPGTPLFTIEDTSKVEVLCNLRMDELRWVWQQQRDDAPTPGPGGSSEAEGYVLPSSISTTDESGGDASEAAVAIPNQYSLPPTPATVKYELGGQAYTWKGTLTRYDGIGLDERTRMVPCRVVIEKPRDVYLNGEPLSRSGGPRALVRGMYVTVVLNITPRTQLLRIPEDAVQPGNIVWRVNDGKLQPVVISVAQSIEDAVIVEATDDGLAVGDRLVVSQLNGSRSQTSAAHNQVESDSGDEKGQTHDALKFAYTGMPVQEMPLDEDKKDKGDAAKP